MYFIIFVISWFVTIAVRHIAPSVDKGLLYREKHFQRGLWSILVNIIKGFNLGYTAWFIYYVGTFLYAQYTLMGA
jgi:hypothetical protein